MIDTRTRLFSSTAGILVPAGLSSKIFKKVTHCIFDMDGTLLDSEFVYHQMIHTICEKYGKNYSKEMEHKYYGGTDREICTAVVKELKMPISADEMESQLTIISSKMLPHSPLMSGAERLLKHLHDYKIPMALATNSTEQAVRLHVATKPAFFGMFNHKVSVTDPGVLRGKPHPDLYLLAASKFHDKPKPARCLVFEDSEKGVLAAKEAGMQVVMIPDLKIDREKTRHATLIIRSLLDFKPELFGLPPFDGTKGDNKAKLDKNKGPDTGLPSLETKTFEVTSSKDGIKNSIIEREEERKTFVNAAERKSVRLSIIDKLVGRTSIQDRPSLDTQPHGIRFIDKLLERKYTEKGVGKKDKRPHRIVDERKSKSERLGNRKVSISEGPYQRKSVTFDPERSFENSMLTEHARRSIVNESEIKSQRSVLENKTRKFDEDQRKGADDQRQQKSKK